MKSKTLPQRHLTINKQQMGDKRFIVTMSYSTIRCKVQQEEQYTYNVTLRRVREISLPGLCVRACVHVGTRTCGRVHTDTCM
jgi:hypothetical protein